MRGPVFRRTGSKPSLTPPPAPPRSEAFPGEASCPSPAARLRSARRARDSSIPQAVRAAGGGGARGEGAERRCRRGAGPGVRGGPEWGVPGSRTTRSADHSVASL